MAKSRAVTLDCPAKLNLALAVGDALGRDHPSHPGYHPVESWMVAIDLCDTLSVARAVDDASIVFDLAFAEDAPRPQEIDWPLTADLTYRAHRAVELHAQRTLPVDVSLRKRIPVGSGLGGGSADAAGMILALDQLFGLALEHTAMIGIAATLGSDVAFALAATQGEPSAIATSFGETLTPLPLPSPIHALLILPDFGCATSAVYRAFDAIPPGVRRRWSPGEVASLAAKSSGPAMRMPSSLFNDLTAAAITVQPRVGKLIEELGDAVGRPVHLTGSGSACFVLTDSTEEVARLAQLAEAATRGHGAVIRAVRTLSAASHR